MIDEEKRRAVWCLHKDGMNISELSRRLHLNRKTVRRIIKDQGQPLEVQKRSDKMDLDPELVAELFQECGGWAERMHEKMKDKGMEVAYSTLTARIRELGLRSRESEGERAHQVPDQAGEEIQHDTSPYTITIGEKRIRVQASLVYWRFSKIRYLKFYQAFTRFHMKCFFHEALIFYQYTCGTCIIDNTHLAVLRGTGERAIFVPEMIAFAKQYGFKWKAHRLKHANRKAGNERGFWTVETNFFPGRTFTSMEDLNRQALLWVGKRNTTPNKKSKAIPLETFEWEKKTMIKVPEGLPAPYQIHERSVDQYGFIAFYGNFFWIPKGTSGKVTLLEYSGEIHVYQKRKLLLRYPLPDESIKGRKWVPEGVDLSYRPKKRTTSMEEEEKRLRLLGTEVCAFVDKAMKEPRGPQGRYRWIREFLALSQRMTPSLLIKTLARADKYGVIDIKTLERIAMLILKKESTPDLDLKWEVDSGMEERESFLEGKWSEIPDLDLLNQKYRRDEDEREIKTESEIPGDEPHPAELELLSGGGDQKEPLL